MDGDVAIAHRGVMDVLMNSLLDELIAFIQGVQVAVAMGVGHVISETDAMEVVQAVYSNAFGFRAVTNLTEELRSLSGL